MYIRAQSGECRAPASMPSAICCSTSFDVPKPTLGMAWPLDSVIVGSVDMVESCAEMLFFEAGELSACLSALLLAQPLSAGQARYIKQLQRAEGIRMQLCVRLDSFAAGKLFLAAKTLARAR